MKLYLYTIIFLFGISCGQTESNSSNYAPYHKVLKTRQIGNADDVIQKLFSEFNANPTTQEEIDQNLIIEYLTDNKISASKTKSGIYYMVYKYGTGAQYVRSQQFSARYTGYFLDGRVFDANIEANQPLIKRVGEMIQGWNEALPLFAQGAKVSLFIPSKLGYGKTGIKGVIPPNSVLVFDIELVP